ncbi:MAG: type II secretion system GspH family protein [Lentisphaerales bacterium]|nr:type II secretion system GspH family protein [Lentisphaerales bacterium]
MKKFTLIELMLVISVISILITILLPSLRNARESAQSAVCQSNTLQIFKASQIWYKDNDHFPLDRWGWAIELDLILTGEDVEDLQSPAFICPKDTRDNLGVGWKGMQSYAQNASVSDSNTDLKRMFQVNRPNEVMQFGDSDTDDIKDQSVTQKHIDRFPVLRHFDKLGRNFSFVDGHAKYVSWAKLLNREESPYFYIPED